MTSYIYNMVDTWALSGGPYTSIKMNATDNDSGSASLLMDLQVGGASKFSVSKAGTITAASLGFTTSVGMYPNVIISSSSGNWGLHLASTAVVDWAQSADFTDTKDLLLTRRAAANLRFGAADAAAPVAQTLSVQSVVAGTTNTAGTNLTITGSQGTGTGAGGSIVFQVAPAGSSGSAQNALTAALTIDAGASKAVTVNFGLIVQGETGTNIISIGGGYAVTVPNNGFLRWSSTTLGTGSPDVILARDAANTLALRNGTTAQAFNIYNTYTSGTSYERYSVDWITTANLVIVGPNKGSSGGTQRVQRLSYLEDGGAGSTVPLLGSTCPAASGTVKSWIKVITSDGTTAYIPCWA